MEKMRSSFYDVGKQVSCLLAVIVFFASVEVSAGGEGEYRNSDYIDLAYLFVESGAAGVALKEPRNELGVIKVWEDKQENIHVRFRQLVERVPVWGGELLIHMKPDGSVYNMSDSIVAGMAGKIPDVLLSPDECVVLIHGLPGEHYKNAWLGTPELWVDLVDGLPKKVYRVEARLGLKREFLFIDANNGGLIKKMTGSPTI